MFATRRMHLEIELMKWIVIILMALAIAAIMAVRTAGGGELTPAAEPQPFPMEMGNVAKAIAQPPAKPFFPETPPRITAVDPQLAKELWAVLQKQQVGNVEGALAGWKKIILPPTAQTWRHIALGVCELQVGNLERAELELDAAKAYTPRHPLIAYYRGILRMEQATERGIMDAEQAARIRLVAFRVNDVVPATRGMYQLAALVEFNDTLAWADELNLADPLIEEAGEEGPTVGDFLQTIGALNYVGQTHNMLAVLYLDRGMLTEAEEHLDAAVATGIEVPFGYRDLGQAFEELDQNGDAVRAYLKAMKQHGAGWVRPGLKVLENLQRFFAW